MSDLKKLVWFGVIAALVFLGLMLMSTRAEATSFHREWSNYGSWSNWGECKTDAQCGYAEGTQSRHRSRVCELHFGGGYNECSYIGQIDTQEQSRGCEVELPACEEEECPPGTHEVKDEVKTLQEQDGLVCVPDEEPAPECKENCGTPPTFAGSTTLAPVCPNGSTTNVVANPHVIRKGTEATVNFFITEGDSANIYYSEVGQPHWQHAVADVKPNGDRFVSFTVKGLDANKGYDFGIQQKLGCGGGKTTAVVVDDPTPRTFTLSYWE